MMNFNSTRSYQMFKASFACIKEVARHKSTESIGFIGLGNMGKPMALNLLKSNHKLHAFDVLESTRESMVDAGAEVCSTPAEVAEKASVIITMLPNSSHVEEVYLGENGILKKVQSGALMIDSSTIDPAVSRKIFECAAGDSATYMDAPVSGGVTAAAGGTLTFMVGGPEPEFERAKKVLEHMGKSIVRCGDVGTGQAVKLCNNMLLASSMIATAEAMNLGIRLGLDPKLLASIMGTSTGRCWSVDTYNPVPGVNPGVPSSNGYKGGFACALMAKDLRLGQQAAVATESKTEIGKFAAEFYQKLCEQGFAEKDFSSVFEYLQN